MASAWSELPRVFLDADVIFAGAASPAEYAASQIVLALGQFTLIRCTTSEQAVQEAERNIARKLPAKLPELRSLIRHALDVVPNPTREALMRYQGLAEPKDLPILVAALEHRCPRLLTFNTRHFWPPEHLIKVQRPGDFLRDIREALARLDAGAR